MNRFGLSAIGLMAFAVIGCGNSGLSEPPRTRIDNPLPEILPKPVPPPSPCPTNPQVGDVYSINNGATSLELVFDQQGWSIHRVIAADGFAFSLVSAGSTAQFAFRFMMPDRKIKELAGETYSGVGRLECLGPQDIELVWEHLAPSDSAMPPMSARLAISLPPNNPYAEIRLRAEQLVPVDFKKYAFHSAELRLQMADADPLGGNDEFVLQGRGSQAVADPINSLSQVFRIFTPNAGLTMDVWPYIHHGASGDDHLLYLAVHDPKMWNKWVSMGADPAIPASDRTLQFRVEHLGAYGSTEIEFPYPVALGASRGGWYKAAQVFRGFIQTQTDWWARGDLATRVKQQGSPVARAAKFLLNELHISTRVKDPNDPELKKAPFKLAEEQARRLANHHRFINPVDPTRHLLLDWGWYEGSIFRLSEGVGPYRPRHGYTALLQAQTNLGASSGAYTLMLGFDATQPEFVTWNIADGVRWTSLGPPQGPTRSLDPSAIASKEYLARTLVHLRAIGLNHLHNDDFAPPGPCYSLDHGHMVPGGHYWYDAARQLLRTQEKAGFTHDTETGTFSLSPTIMITHGAYGPETVTTNSSMRAIPMAQAVGHDYQLSTGYTYDLEVARLVYAVEKDPIKLIPVLEGLRSNLAVGIAWGTIPLLEDISDKTTLIGTPFDAVAQMLKKATYARRIAEPWLVFGRMLMPPQTDAKVVPRVTLSTGGQFAPRYFDEVPASGFVSPSGEVLMVLVNPSLSSDGERTLQVTIPASWPLASNQVVIEDLETSQVVATGQVGQPLPVSITNGAVRLLRVR